MAVNPELPYPALRDPIDLRLAQAASIPAGYRSIPAYTVKIVEQGVQFISAYDSLDLDRGQIYENRTFVNSFATLPDDTTTIAVAVQSKNGQVRVIPAGTPLSAKNLQDGDRIYYPQRQQQEQQQEQQQVYTPQPLPAQTIRQLNTTDKLIEAMKLSVNKVDDEFVESLQAFLQPETLAVMGGQRKLFINKN
jgi:hypothetical protein